ncbi:MAG: LytR C-terminal domain-containing protein [Sciscionella sp.]
MTSSSRPSPGKVAGFLLLGIAAVALVIGLVTAVGGNQASRASDGGSRLGGGQSVGSSASGSATSSSAPASSGIHQPESHQPESRPSGATTKVVPSPGAGGRDGGAVGSGGGQARNAVNHSAPVRVYNNSTIKGLAARAAADFRAAGYDVVRVDNYPQGVIPASTVYWGSGSGEKATARSLAREIGMRAAPRFPGIAKASHGVIAIVTNNFSR